MYNRNMLFAAIPFAVVSDVALMVKAFTGYSDNTLTVLAVACAVVALLMVLKAVGYLQMPTFSGRSCEAPVREVHHHHYHDEDEPKDECEDDTYSEEDLSDAREEGRSEGYHDGYDHGHEQGYDAGYAERESEETTEADELAKSILNALKTEADVTLKPQPVQPQASDEPLQTGTRTDTPA